MTDESNIKEALKELREFRVPPEYETLLKKAFDEQQNRRWESRLPSLDPLKRNSR